MAFDLAASRAVLDLPEDEVRHKLGGPGGETEANVRYEGLDGVTMYYNPAVLPARVYVRDGRVQMVYVPSGSALDGLTPADLERQLVSKGIRLRSRAGKRFGHHVFAEDGVAYSSDRHGVRFVEVFPPRSHEAYVSEIYREPGRFIR